MCRSSRVGSSRPQAGDPAEASPSGSSAPMSTTRRRATWCSRPPGTPSNRRSPGSPSAVLQPHIEGDLIKFYGIGPGGGPDGEPPWFRWFYHKGQRVAGHPFDPRRLARLVRRAAAALGLEVYGGDVIVA